MLPTSEDQISKGEASLSTKTGASCADPFKDITAVFTNTSGPVSCDNDILVCSELFITKKNIKKALDKYFILTTEEAYAAKLKQREEKDKRESNKKMNRKKQSQAKKWDWGKLVASK